MKRKFLRTLVLVLTALTAVSVFVCTDGFREYEAGYIQGEMLKASTENVTARPDLHVYYPALVAASGQNRYSSSSATAMKPLALVSLSTCILRC